MGVHKLGSQYLALSCLKDTGKFMPIFQFIYLPVSIFLPFSIHVRNWDEFVDLAVGFYFKQGK